MSLGLLTFLAKGVACTLYNYSQKQKNQSMGTKAIGMNGCPQPDSHSEKDLAFKHFVQSLYGKEYSPMKIQLNSREISYAVSDAITISYDYNSYYLLIKAYLETKDLPKETLRSRILGDNPNLSQVFMSIPYDAICIAMPPSCNSDNKTVTGIVDRIESILKENEFQIEE